MRSLFLFHRLLRQLLHFGEKLYQVSSQAGTLPGVRDMTDEPVHLAPYLGFVPLPWQFWPILAATLLCYVGLTQLVKMWLLKKGWI